MTGITRGSYSSATCPSPGPSAAAPRTYLRDASPLLGFPAGAQPGNLSATATLLRPLHFVKTLPFPRGPASPLGVAQAPPFCPFCASQVAVRANLKLLLPAHTW